MIIMVLLSLEVIVKHIKITITQKLSSAPGLGILR